MTQKRKFTTFSRNCPLRSRKGTREAETGFKMVGTIFAQVFTDLVLENAKMHKSILPFTLLAALLFANPLAAHGGTYRGPGDTVPPAGGGAATPQPRSLPRRRFLPRKTPCSAAAP